MRMGIIGLGQRNQTLITREIGWCAKHWAASCVHSGLDSHCPLLHYLEDEGTACEMREGAITWIAPDSRRLPSEMDEQ